MIKLLADKYAGQHARARRTESAASDLNRLPAKTRVHFRRRFLLLKPVYGIIGTGARLLIRPNGFGRTFRVNSPSLEVDIADQPPALGA